MRPRPPVPETRTPSRRRLPLGAAVTLALALAAPGWPRSGEPPVSFQKSLRPLPTVESLALPAVDRAKRLAEDARRAKPGPLRYAIPVDVAVTPESHGTWETLADGRLWRLRVHSPGATDLNFGFTRYRLPAGATLHVWSESRSTYEGPYSDRDHKAHGQLWTPPVPGERAVVELFLPAAAAGEAATLELTRVGTGYRDLFRLAPAPDKQGSCNIDVVCPEGDPWRDPIRSVAAYSLGGALFCTGQMIADVPGSFRNFFLTANHCGMSPANAASMVVFWNFESPVCGQLSGGSLADNQTGATFRASRADADFALLELDDPPDPAFGVFYSGWGRTGTAPVGSVGIHHPDGDEKAISFNDDLLTSGPNCILGGTPNTHWYVDNWEQGTTEPGSSGSGLWNPDNQKLIGFLTGGAASCEDLEFDCYGKLSASWNGPSAATRLRDWLDPAGTGAMMVDGADPNAEPPTCVPDANTLCLNDDRFRVEVSWDTGELTGPAVVVPGGSDDSANLWFFSPNNWEVLIKVLDGCGINDRYWVFFAATTDVAFTVTVTDTENEDEVQVYTNELGQPADAITDTSAFATCP